MLSSLGVRFFPEMGEWPCVYAVPIQLFDEPMDVMCGGVTRSAACGTPSRWLRLTLDTGAVGHRTLVLPRLEHLPPPDQPWRHPL